MAVLLSVPAVLLSRINPNDPFVIIKHFRIKCWWLSFLDLFDSDRTDASRDLRKFAKILSFEDCWRNVDSLHGLKLDREILGNYLMDESSHRVFAIRFQIACRYCLVDDIADLINRSKTTRLFDDLFYSISENVEGRVLWNDYLANFWLHYLSGRERYLKTEGRNVFEYGFECAIIMKQPQAMEYFWGRIKLLPENEVSNQRKENIIMKYAVYAVDKCYSRPEIFEFIFSKVNPEKYSELLEKDLLNNNCYRSLSTLLRALRFDEFIALLDCLKPDQIPVRSYSTWIRSLGMIYLSGRFMDEAVTVLKYMWKKEGFNEHRSAVHNELAVNSAFQECFLVPLINQGYIELLWVILDEARPEHIEKYMSSSNANRIRALLKDDQSSLGKFLSYQVVVME